MSTVISLLMMLTTLGGLAGVLALRHKRARWIAFGAMVGAWVLLLSTAQLIDVPVDNMVSSLASFLITAGTFAVLCLGLNIHWGYTGLFNIGVAGFFGVGAYVSTILVQDPAKLSVGTGAEGFFATYYNLPFPVGFLGAMALSGIVALVVGWATLRLRADYLAIATIGISEILRLIVSNEPQLTEGTRGVPNIPQPLHQCLVEPVNVERALPPCNWFGWEVPQFLPAAYYNWVYLFLVLAVIVVVYLALQRIARSPWGRTLRAIREDEDAAQSLGKNTLRFKLQAFIVGAVIMGAAGSLWAHFVKFVSPEILGGTGNNRGAILGAFVMWAVWSATSFLNDVLPQTLSTPVGTIDVAAQLFGPLRIMSIVLVLELILLYRPRGFLGEEKHTSAVLQRADGD